MLSAEQDQIIKERFKNHEPLNISAMEREHPDIIKVCFEDKECLGWRKNLLRLGIDPYAIEHEHSETIECLICGKFYQILPSHLKAHGITSEEYLDEFGQWTELSSDTFRARKFQNLALDKLAHWEHLWSPYYIIDYVIGMNEVGYPCNANFACENISLGVRCLRYFEGWDDVLSRADIHNARLKSIETRWSKRDIIEALQNVERERKLGNKTPISDGLRNAIQRNFNNFNEAYKFAGVYPENIRSVNRYTDDELQEVILEVKALGSLYGKERRKQLQKTFDRYKPIITTRYNSLPNLAKAHGIALSTVSLEYYRNEQDVIHDLKVLKQQGKTLSRKDISEYTHRLYVAIRKKGWGKHMLEKRQPDLFFPKHDPQSNKLKDQLIRWRVKLNILRIDAAKSLAMTERRYRGIESEGFRIRPAEVVAIKKAFKEAGLPQAWDDE